MPAAAQRVLVVEDEIVVAMLIEEMLLDLGYEVHVAMRLEPGMHLAETATVDFAVLDVNLGGRLSMPIADILHERGIPFLFASGYGAGGLSGDHKDRVMLRKPFLSGDLSAAISAAIH